MSEYIKFIEKTIDNVVTDIYLHDSRISDNIAAEDIGKGLVVTAEGTISPVKLHYLPVSETDSNLLLNDLNLGDHKIINIAKGVADSDAVNVKQLNDAIKDIGTVFHFKGVVEKYSKLPTTGNKIGDVWYVENDEVIEGVLYPGHVGYVWIEDIYKVKRWEMLGPIIDLSDYLKISNLAKTTGDSETTAMTQKATTEIDTIARAAIPKPVAPEDGAILTYDKSTSKWIGKTSSSVGVLELDTIDDSITIQGSKAYPKIGVQLSSKEYNSLQVITEEGKEGLYTSSAQSDWTETDTNNPSYIKNKPELGTASEKDALVGSIKDNPTSGNLVSSSQVSNYVGKKTIFVGPDAPTDSDVSFWLDTSSNKLKYKANNTWVIAGGEVDSVNGKTGAVNLNADDVGAIEAPESPAENDHLIYSDGKWQAKQLELDLSGLDIKQDVVDSFGTKTTTYDEITDNRLNTYIIDTDHELVVNTKNNLINEAEHCLQFDTATVLFIDEENLLLLQ